MTTASQVKTAMKPLLQMRNDLALIGRTIYLKPAGHIAGCIFFDRTGRSDRFLVKWHLNHLFGVLPPCAPNHGKHLLTFLGGSWAWNRWHTVESLLYLIENEALPVLRRVTTIDDYICMANLLHDNKWEHWEDIDQNPSEEKKRVWLQQGYPKWYKADHIIIEIARGRLSEALSRCQEFESWDLARVDDGLREHVIYIMTVLKPLLERDDRRGLASALHAKERENVFAHKLEKIWRPTPFPLEEMG